MLYQCPSAIAAAKPACSELAAGHGLANAVAYDEFKVQFAAYTPDTRSRNRRRFLERVSSALDAVPLFYSNLFLINMNLDLVKKLKQYVAIIKSFPSMYCTYVSDEQLLRYRQKSMFVIHNKK